MLLGMPDERFRVRCISSLEIVHVQMPKTYMEMSCTFLNVHTQTVGGTVLSSKTKQGLELCQPPFGPDSSTYLMPAD